MRQINLIVVQQYQQEFFERPGAKIYLKKRELRAVNCSIKVGRY